MNAYKTPLLLVGLYLPGLAHAYIDPGSGSFIIQMFVASMIGAMLSIKMYYNAIKTKLRSIFGKDKSIPANNTTQNDPNPQENHE